MSGNFQLTSTLYRRNYGPMLCRGPIIVNTLKYVGVGDVLSLSKLSDALVIPDQKYHIVLNIDLSGSMRGSIQEMKNTLNVIRDVCDDLFGTIILFSVIGFSNDAHVLFSHLDIPESHESPVINNSSSLPYQDLIFDDIKRSDTWEEMIDSIKAMNSTNLGAGFEKSELMIKTAGNIPSWLITISDGDSNKGICQSSKEISKTIEDMKDRFNLETVALGYGVDHRPDILSSCGKYTYMEKNSENVYQTIVFQIMEIIRSVAIKGSFNITPPIMEDGNGRVIFGREETGSVNVDMTSYYAFMPYSDTIDEKTLKSLQSKAEAWVGCPISCSLTTIQGNTIDLNTEVKDGGDSVDQDSLLEYFKTAEAELLKSISKRVSPFNVNSKLSDWPTTIKDLDEYDLYEPSIVLDAIECHKTNIKSFMDKNPNDILHLTHQLSEGPSYHTVSDDYVSSQSMSDLSLSLTKLTRQASSNYTFVDLPPPSSKMGETLILDDEYDDEDLPPPLLLLSRH